MKQDDINSEGEEVMRVEVIGNATLYLGDCLEVLRTLPDASVDSIVTDPPYGLAFMGKKWDYAVPSVEVWAECLRVLKPGGHLLAFAGTRTQHRMAVRIEDAGFEIRDMIAWVYGSGFPKSLDVSKAIDKMDAADARRARQLRFTEWVRSTGLTSAEIDRITGTNMGGHYTTAARQPAVATREHFERLRPHFGGDVPEWVEQLVDERTVESENFKRREVIGVQNGAMSGWNTDGRTKFVDRDITLPATEAARQWQGWGTALKPALEPITVARKPLVGTVAENVLQYGTGALNIDGCRVPLSGEADAAEFENNHRVTERLPQNYDGQPLGLHDGGWKQRVGEAVIPPGRWPANLIHDGSDEVMAAFPDAPGQQRAVGPEHGDKPRVNCYGDMGARPYTPPRADTGSAARFFYCAKASKRDRDEGLDHLPKKPGGMVSNTSGQHMTRRDEGYQVAPRANNHPTVKPTDLMRYLCRLVTPPGGTVLDPFMGSGSTGKAAMLEGFRFIGIEREAEYVDIACRRIEDAQRQGRLI